jgi:dUTP pyrophosphatase
VVTVVEIVVATVVATVVDLAATTTGDAGTVVVATTLAGADNTPLRVRVIARPEAIPTYASAGAAGADLRAAIADAQSLSPGERLLIPTGVRLELPLGCEGQVRPRSGLAVRSGITVLNAPGTIDSDYRGEILVPLINHSTETFILEPNMRIAQLVIAPVVQAAFTVTDTLTESTRGPGGFGSTGME